MSNERLRDALIRNGLALGQVAAATGVDHKTVERWITKGRTPYRRHRHTIASMVNETENYLWPDAVNAAGKAAISEAEIVQVYPHRHSVPGEAWARLLRDAHRYIDVLVYAGMFLVDDPDLIKNLRSKAEAGAKVRILLGDPNSREVRLRSEEEGIGKDALPAKVRNALAVYQHLDGAPGISVKCHATTLYNSIYRFDNDMLVNTHVYGFMAAHAPVLHLRRLAGGGLFETYSASFDSVWNTAKAPKW